MGREISLFSDYHSKENSLTNYCGLILKLLYEENPKGFEEVLVTLISDDINISVGPSFTQQTKEQKSIPDLTIQQNSFSIFFETKLDDWFYSKQVQNHIAGIKNQSKFNILFLISNFEVDDLQQRFADDIKVARDNGVILEPITFEDFVGAIEKVESSDQYKKFFKEFVSYLDKNGRLPKWKYLLDVVNCKGTMKEIEQGVYICPDTSGAYSHRRAKFFGPYSNKTVSTIFEVKAVVSIEKGLSDGEVKWKNSSIDDDELINDAMNKIKESHYDRISESNQRDLQVFLLEKGAPTNFYKSTSGGMLQSKKYFWDIARDCSNSYELAEKLMDEPWGKFENKSY